MRASAVVVSKMGRVVVAPAAGALSGRVGGIGLPSRPLVFPRRSAAAPDRLARCVPGLNPSNQVPVSLKEVAMCVPSSRRSGKGAHCE